MPEAKAALAEAIKFESQTLRGVVSRAHTLAWVDADPGFPRSPDQGRAAGGMSETRKLAAILARMWSAIPARRGGRGSHLARLRALRSDLIDPTIASIRARRQAHRRRSARRVPQRRRRRTLRDRSAERHDRAQRRRARGRCIDFRIGIHLGDVVEESDGDLMGDGVNIAARLEGIAKPGAICLSEQAYRQVRRGSISRSPTSGQRSSRTSPSQFAPIRCRSAIRQSPKPPASPARTGKSVAMLAPLLAVVALVLIAAGAGISSA